MTIKLTALQPVYTGQLPYTSVHVDVSRASARGEHDVEVRWRDLAAELDTQGVEAHVRDMLAERVLAPTGIGGELGRTIVVAGADVVLDELLERPPRRDDAAVGRVPHLMPLLRARSDRTPYLLVKVDHAGADVVFVESTTGAVDSHTSEGGHDVLHKVAGGGWSQRRYQSRVQDSWERNATAVARDIDTAVAEHAPPVVFLTGEASARSLVREHASGRVTSRLVDLQHGSRAEGISEESLYDEIDVALAHHRANANGVTTDAFAARLGADEAVANGFDAVVDALRRGAVETLLLLDQPESTLRLLAGPDALQLGRTDQELAALGVQDTFEERADEIIVRALVAQGADLVLVDEPRDDLRDGIGALLRFDSRPARPGGG